MHYLSLAAIFRCENSWLDEWMRYHLAIGIEHFYLFNHDENTKVSDRILRPYVETGLVENIHVMETVWGKNEIPSRLQITAYREVLKKSAKTTKWLAIIDLDEFILPKRKNDVRELLAEYENFSALGMNWQIFGTSGHVKRPPSQIQHLLHRADTFWANNMFIKSIVQPRYVNCDAVDDVHYFPMISGITVNEKQEKISGMRHDISTNEIQLNHYSLRSWQDFWEVKAPRPRFNGVAPCNEDYFFRHDRNEVYDDEIKRRFGHLICESLRKKESMA